MAAGMLLVQLPIWRHATKEDAILAAR